MSSGRFRILLLAAFFVACTPASDKDKVSEFVLTETEADSLGREDSSDTLRILPPTASLTPRMRISEYDHIIKKYSRRYGFDWRLIAAQIFVESRFRLQARSGRGAVGLMQIMPGTAKYLGVDINQLIKPEQNIALGCYYDRRLYNLWKNKRGTNRLAFTLASYNAGRTRVLRAENQVASEGWATVKPHLPRETRNYVGRIFSKYEEYKKSFIY